MNIKIEGTETTEGERRGTQRHAIGSYKQRALHLPALARVQREHQKKNASEEGERDGRTRRRRRQTPLV